MNINDILKPIVGTMGDTKVVVGAYSSINGPDAIPLHGIEITKDELRAVVKHHAELLLAVDQCWADGQSGSWEIRQYPYSSTRVSYFEEFLGSDEVETIFKDVYKDFYERDPEIPE
jgi:hypothetical protein